MMLESLGQAALRTALLAAIVQLGLALLDVQRPQLRLTAWTVVLAASLAMPALQRATPLELSVFPDLRGGPASTEAANGQRLTFVSSAALSDGNVATPIDFISLLEAVYVPIAGILLVRLIVGIALALRLLSKAAPVYSDWAAGDTIRISNEIAAPVTVAQVILLPADVVNWPAGMRDAVLAHERAHIARWDFAMLLVSQVNQAVFWFSPLSWWLHRRLTTFAELASDDQAMRATGDRAGYAEVLLEMGRRSGPLLPGVAMARPATLQYRIERIVSDRGPATSARPVQQIALAVGAASLSVLVASSRQKSAPLLASVPWTEPPAAEAGRQPTSVPQIEHAAQIAHSVPEPEAAKPAKAPAARGTIVLTARPKSRNTLSPALQRAMVQRIQTERDPATDDAPLNRGAIVAASLASRTSSHEPDPLPARPSALLKRVEPHCTGVYTPGPETPPTNGSIDFVQTKYVQERDGTPWLKLYLGSRTRARLTGFDVDRISVRATVVTRLPRGTGHVIGSTGGAYGTIDFECTQPPAHL